MPKKPDQHMVFESAEYPVIPTPLVPTELEAVDVGNGMVVMGRPEAIEKVRELILHDGLANKVDPAEAVRDLLAPHHENHNRLDWLQAQMDRSSGVSILHVLGKDTDGNYTIYTDTGSFRGADLRAAIDAGRTGKDATARFSFPDETE